MFAVHVKLIIIIIIIIIQLSMPIVQVLYQAGFAINIGILWYGCFWFETLHV